MTHASWNAWSEMIRFIYYNGNNNILKTRTCTNFAVSLHMCRHTFQSAPCTSNLLVLVRAFCCLSPPHVTGFPSVAFEPLCDLAHRAASSGAREQGLDVGRNKPISSTTAYKSRALVAERMAARLTRGRAPRGAYCVRWKTWSYPMPGKLEDGLREGCVAGCPTGTSAVSYGHVRG